MMGGCTFNFDFYDGVLEEHEEPTGYVGTAAHCTDGVGEVVYLPKYGRVGTVVYDADDVCWGVDFSLIEVDDGVVADTNPTMRGFDGPHGSVTVADLAVGDIVDQHGYGVVLGENDITRSRQGVLVNWDDDEYVVDGPFVNGDSGSPLLHDETGFALGIISRYGLRGDAALHRYRADDALHPPRPAGCRLRRGGAGVRRLMVLRELETAGRTASVAQPSATLWQTAITTLAPGVV